MSNDILTGLRIIEGSAFVAAPMGGMTLAQLGAEVIRFDMIGGGIDYKRWPLSKDGASLYWAGLNKGKKSVAINLRDPRGQELIAGLITHPDPNGGIFLTNIASAKWLQHEVLTEKREDLISLHILGNRDGTTAVDYTVNSAAGFPFVTGDGSADTPVNSAIPAWDIATALHASTAILAAERHRRLHGKGQLVKIALSDVAFAVAGHLGYIGEAQINKADRERTGNYLYGAFGRNFATKDGRQVIVIAISQKQWRGLCAVTGIADKISKLEELLEVNLNNEGDRYRSSEIIAALIEPWFKQHTLEEMHPKLNEHGVCWGPYQSFQQMIAEDARVSEQNPMFQNVFQPGIGDYLSPGSPLDFSEFERGAVAPAPLLGQHTDEVLLEYLGLSEQQLGKLHDDGIIAGSET